MTEVTEGLRKQIVAALEGDSNDAERDALAAVAEELGVRYADSGRRRFVFQPIIGIVVEDGEIVSVDYDQSDSLTGGSAENADGMYVRELASDEISAEKDGPAKVACDALDEAGDELGRTITEIVSGQE